MGYNPKDLWSISRLHKIHSEREEHPTQKPVEIIERMIKASSPINGLVCDPFAGSGTTIEACIRNSRHYIGFELNNKYFKIIQKRIERIKDKTQNYLFTNVHSRQNTDSENIEKLNQNLLF